MHLLLICRGNPSLFTFTRFNLRKDIIVFIGNLLYTAVNSRNRNNLVGSVHRVVGADKFISHLLNTAEIIPHIFTGYPAYFTIKIYLKKSLKSIDQRGKIETCPIFFPYRGSDIIAVIYG